MDRVNRLHQQNYDEIKAKCLKSGVLFEDDLFPLSKAFYKVDSKIKIKWVRPMEMVTNGKFYLDASTTKMTAGELGCLCLVGAISALVTQHPLLEWVVPLTQTFDESSYAGIFYFRIWHYGKWNVIVVDDRLPTIAGKPIRLHDKSLSQFWCSLLEKAYAKLLGCYDVLFESNVGEILEDFTGGLTESYKMPSEIRPGFFHILYNSLSRFSLLVVYVEGDDKKRQQMLENGFLTNTYYVLNSLHILEVGDRSGNDSQIQFVGFKNAWNNSQWRGAWRINAPEWYLISDDDRDKFDRTVDFWMLFTDFCINFSRVYICNVTRGVETLPKNWNYLWRVEQHEDCWEVTSTAVNQEALLKSPKFIVFRTQEEQTGDIVVGLMQTVRKIKDTTNVKLDILNIGFVVYALDVDNEKKLEKLSPESINYTPEWFNQHKPLTKVKFTRSREVAKRFTAKPGNYLIVLCAEGASKNSPFLLRIFQEIVFSPKEVSLKREVKPERLRFLIPDTVDIVCDSNQQMLDAFELEANLRKNLVTPTVSFSLDQCRSLIALFDERKEGKMSMREFNSLCILINTVYETFLECGKEPKDTLVLDELHKCLIKLGFELNRSLLELLMCRYGNSRPGFNGLDFPNLVICTIRMQNVFLYWHNKKHNQTTDNQHPGLSFTLRELLEQIIYS